MPQIAIPPRPTPRSAENGSRAAIAEQLRILTIGLLLAHSLSADLRCVPDPQLKLQVPQQALKPTRVPAALHAYTHAHCGTNCQVAKNMTPDVECIRRCVKKGEKGAKYWLWSGDKVYVLEPQPKVMPLAGKNVKVTGTLSGDTIQVETVEVQVGLKP